MTSTIPPSGSVPSRPPVAPEPSPPTAEKLPVGAVIGAAYRSVFGDSAALLQRTWVWFAIILGASLVSGYIANRLGEPRVQLVAILASLAGAIALGVSWSRSVLLGEPTSTFAAVRFGRREWRYLGIGLVTAIAAFGPLVLLSTIFLRSPGGVPSGGFAAAAVSVGAVLWMLYVVPRLSLAFALVAVDAPPGVIGRSWALTRGAWLRILGAIIPAALPFAVIGGLLNRAAERATSASGLLILGAGLILLSLVQVAVMSALTAHIYVHLSGWRADAARAPTP